MRRSVLLRRPNARRLDLILRMTEAKARLLERGMLPRAFVLAPADFALIRRSQLDFIPVRVRRGKSHRSALYSASGCQVLVPLRLPVR